MVKAITLPIEHEAFHRYKRIVGLIWQAEKTFLELGEELCIFQEQEQWRELEYRSFEAFLADPDVNMSRRTAYRLIRVWKLYGQALNVQHEKLIAIGTTKLDMIASHVDQNNVDRWLNTAATLSKSDLRAELDGTEPVYTPVAWRELLRETRNMALMLSERETAPQEVREFSLDFYVATEMWN